MKATVPAVRLVGFDVETAGDGEAFGLQPYRVLQGQARITSAAFVDEDGGVIWAGLETVSDFLAHIRDTLKALASEPNVYLIGWNTQFDVAWLIANGLEREVRACKWLDGEVLRRAIENDTTDKSYGLKPTVAKYLPQFAGYEKQVAGNFDKVDDTLLHYNILDARLTVELGRLFIDELLQGSRLLRLSALICKAIVPVAKAWVSGIPIDREAVTAWEAHATADKLAHFDRFVALAGIKEDERELAEKMLASPVKLKTFLRARGYPVSSTDRVELSKYKNVPMVKAISDWKKQNTAVGKFITSIKKSLDYNQTDTVHPSCRLWNTYTGRFGYTSTTTKKKLQTGIAIHQFPRLLEARNCITAPEGMQLVELDFATQESRLICDWSQDPVMLDIFQRGLDFHTYMAAIIANIDYDDMVDRLASGDARAKEDRYLAKVINLSCQYRTGWKKLIDVGRAQYDVIFDEATARRLHGLYRTTYKGVPQYWEDAIFKAKSRGYAETRGGRRVFISDWSQSASWSSESTAINFPIQGTAADMKFLAIAMVDDMLYDIGARYILDLHDAMFVLVPDTSAGWECAVKMRDICSNLPYQAVFGWKPLIRLPVDLKYGKSWGSLKEVK